MGGVVLLSLSHCLCDNREGNGNKGNSKSLDASGDSYGVGTMQLEKKRPVRTGRCYDCPRGAIRETYHGRRKSGRK